MTRAVRHLLRPVLGTVLSLLCGTAALAQSTVLQGGPWAPGHAPMYVGQGSSQPIIQDGGGAGGGPLGSTISELGITARSQQGTYPSANSGNGPNYSHFCLYDAPTTNLTGFHYFCLDPNSANGGLLSYGAAGGAATLPLQFKVNGETYTFPFGGGSGGGTVGLWSDALNPTATNTFPPITNSYTTGAAGAATLIVNGVAYSDHALNPVFAVFGQTVVWNPINAGFNVTTADQASITYTGLSGTNSGTVTSVAASVPSIMTIAGSPITTSGTLAFGLATEPANTVLAGPTSGSVAVPTFHSLTLPDLPTLAANTLMGSLTASTPSGLAVPSCSSATSYLIWASGTGFGCNSFGALATVTPGTGVATALGIDVGTAGSVVLNGGALGTPSSGTLTNATGLPLSTGVTGSLTVPNGGTGAATFTANAPLIGAGTSAVSVGSRSGNTTTFATATGTLTNGHCVSIDASGNFVDAGGACTTGGGGGTVSAGTAGQLTYYAGSGTTVSGATTGTGVVTALGVNTGSAGAFVVNGGALGTPSSGTLTNATGLPLATGVTGTFNAAQNPAHTGDVTNSAGSLANTVVSIGGKAVSLAGALTTSGAFATTLTTTGITSLTLPTSGTVTALGNSSTGSGSVVLATSPTLVTPALGTPVSGVLTNATGLPLTTGVTGTLPVANGGTGTTTPALVAGTNVTITGSWPNQTINSSGGGGGLTVGSSTITSGTNGYILYNNAGTLANVAPSGTGSVAFTTSPTFVTPVLGTPTSVTLTNATGLPLSSGVTGTLPVANGGTGTSSPGLTGSTGISVSGSWPNQTITNTSTDCTGSCSFSGTVTANGFSNTGSLYSFGSSTGIYGTAGSTVGAEISGSVLWSTFGSTFQLGSGIAGVKDGGGSWTASSDARVKKDVADYKLGLAALKSLHPVTFKYNGKFGTSNTGKTFVGLIAQAVQKTPLADMVGDRVDQESGEKVLTVDNSQLVYALVNAMVESSAKIDRLTAQVAALKKRSARHH